MPVCRGDACLKLSAVESELHEHATEFYASAVVMPIAVTNYQFDGHIVDLVEEL